MPQKKTVTKTTRTLAKPIAPIKTEKYRATPMVKKTTVKKKGL
jgi:hypothetical protein